MIHDPMTAAYIDAIYFTDTGDLDQPSASAELTDSSIHAALSACHRFRLACASHGGIDLSQYRADQLGHDLWLTRNGHGTGFWDRPEIYGDENARIFTLMAKTLGEDYPEFLPEAAQ